MPQDEDRQPRWQCFITVTVVCSCLTPRGNVNTENWTSFVSDVQRLLFSLNFKPQTRRIGVNTMHFYRKRLPATRPQMPPQALGVNCVCLCVSLLCWPIVNHFTLSPSTSQNTAMNETAQRQGGLLCTHITGHWLQSDIVCVQGKNKEVEESDSHQSHTSSQTRGSAASYWPLAATTSDQS